MNTHFPSAFPALLLPWTPLSTSPQFLRFCPLFHFPRSWNSTFPDPHFYLSGSLFCYYWPLFLLIRLPILPFLAPISTCPAPNSTITGPYVYFSGSQFYHYWSLCLLFRLLILPLMLTPISISPYPAPNSISTFSTPFLPLQTPGPQGPPFQILWLIHLSIYLSNNFLYSRTLPILVWVQTNWFFLFSLTFWPSLTLRWLLL